MKKFIFPLILFLLMLSACSNQIEPQTNPTSDVQINKEEQNKIQELQKEVNKLKEELDKTKSHVLNYKADLTVWTEDEIVEGLAEKNKKFENAKWFNYQYRDDGSYYDLIGPIFPVDPFYPLIYEKRNRELTVSHLRLFNLDPGEKGLAQEKYEKYLASVDKATRLNKDLNCIEQTSCRETKLVTCRYGNQTFYVWYAYPYLMTSRNDNQGAYNAFLSLYCEEAKSSLLQFTGNLIRNIKSFFK